ncbi:hypothetical protein ACSDR0_42430 [Streptosporangium sp. G11]|uniref:hypothetical protein n=1 Tax=Streptosporangium sp. G11 TaxID=3436926 RepID=UPI003EC0B62E
MTEAITLYKATPPDCERVLGASHPTTQKVRNHYATARAAASSRPAWWRRVFDIRRRER